eukprot:908560-Rhodomonas_salina.2
MATSVTAKKQPRATAYALCALSVGGIKSLYSVAVEDHTRSTVAMSPHRSGCLQWRNVKVPIPARVSRATRDVSNTNTSSRNAV